MATLDEAVGALCRALSRDVAAPDWRWTVRHQVAAAREALHAEYLNTGEGWLAARAGSLLRERNCLLERLAEAGRLALEGPDLFAVRRQLTRLGQDLAHHAHRIHDLAVDGIALELGGSE